MKTIQKAAEEHRQKGLMMLSNIKLIDYVTVANREKSAYEAGVEFAQRWIPVEEEMPEELKTVIVKRYKPFHLYEITGFLSKDNCFYSNESASKLEKVTHWRPINYK